MCHCSDEDSSDSGAMIRTQEVEIALRRGEQAENDRAKRARTRAARLAAREERRGSREQGSEKRRRSARS